MILICVAWPTRVSSNSQNIITRFVGPFHQVPALRTHHRSLARNRRSVLAATGATRGRSTPSHRGGAVAGLLCASAGVVQLLLGWRGCCCWGFCYGRCVCGHGHQKMSCGLYVLFSTRLESPVGVGIPVRRTVHNRGRLRCHFDLRAGRLCCACFVVPRGTLSEAEIYQGAVKGELTWFRCPSIACC